MAGQVELSQIVAEVVSSPVGELELSQLLAEIAAREPEGSIFTHGVQLSDGENTAERMHGDMTEFLSLLDVPDSYVGEAGNAVVVNATEDGLEFGASLAYTDEQAQDAVGSILTDSASVEFFYDDALNTISAGVDPSGVDHGQLGGLADDDHAQYLKLLGRAGGQIQYGGTASGDDLTLESTSDATKGFVIVQPTTGFVGLNTTVPVSPLTVGSYQSASDPAWLIRSGTPQATPTANVRRSSANALAYPTVAGLGIYNDDLTASNRVPALLFGRRSNATYVTAIAAIDAVDMGQGQDANWRQGALVFHAADNTATALKERMRLGPTEAAINDNGDNYNFRLEDDSANDIVFVDADGFNATGMIYLGASSLPAGIAATKLNLVATGTTSGGQGLTVTNPFTSGAAAGAGMLMYSHDGAAMASGDRLGFFTWGGYDGVTARNSVAIEAFAEEAWSSGVAGSYFRVAIAPIGSATRAEVLRITAAGNLGIGATPSSGTRLAVSAASSETKAKFINTQATPGKVLFVWERSGAFAWTMFLDDADNGLKFSPVEGFTPVTMTLLGDKVGIGVTPTTRFQTLMEGATFYPIWENVVDTADATNYLFRKARGSLAASKSAVQDGDSVSKLLFQGWDGNSYESAALIAATVDGTPGNADMPGRLEFWTTPDASATLALAMTIKSTGRVGIGDAAPGHLLDIAGDANVTGVWMVDDVQVVGPRVVDARCDDTVDTSWGSAEAGVLDALRDAMIAHGLIAAA